MKSTINKFSLTVVAAAVVLSAYGLGVKTGENMERNTLASDTLQNTGSSTVDGLDFSPLKKVLDTLDTKFISTTASSSVPSNSDKVWGAIEGLTASYGDPYTIFFPPKEASAFKEEVRGDFEGVGMEVAIKDDVLTVVAPLKGTPAEKAGLMPGDLILKINDTFTSGMTVDKAIELIRGPRGTTVTLSIRRGIVSKEIKVMRDTINIPTIDTKLRDDGVFVISLYTFSANSASLFRDALREFILSGSTRLVLDLRGNPGGYLDAAVDMASFFIPMGKTVVIEDSGTKAPQQFDRSKGYDVFNENLRMIVLINQGSASASEILAGALKEQGVAKLVGETSFGKGSVQELVQITPETSLKVTIARWLTPLGHSISHNGLTPDVVVPFTQKDADKKQDPQMDKAVELLNDFNFKI